jgi:hypothetical protein
MMMSRQRKGKNGFDLATDKGRLAAIRGLRAQLDSATYKAALQQVRSVDPYPVLQFSPDKGLGFYTRQQLLQAIGKKANSPKLWALLEADSHPRGTVFMVVFHGQQHSWTRTVVHWGGENQ